jgi:phage recombination protein Bet
MAVNDKAMTSEATVIREQLDAVRKVLAPDLTDQELQLFAMVAHRSHLDPFAKQIYAIKRNGKLTFQTGIDGFRASAEETGEYRGSDEPEYGPIVEAPFPHPEWARVTVHRQFLGGDWLHQPATVYWDEYYPGDAGGHQWRKMPRAMLSKAAEAAAFRRAFPKRFGGVYEATEMAQADSDMADRPTSAKSNAAHRRAAIMATTEVVRAPDDSEDAVVVEVVPAPTTASAIPQQCEAVDPYAGDERCRKEDGHKGAHRSTSATWP